MTKPHSNKLIIAPIIFFVILLILSFLANDWSILIISIFAMIFGPLLGLIESGGSYYNLQFKLIFIPSLICVITIFILSFKYKEKWWAFLLLLFGLILWFILAAYGMGPLNLS